MKEKSPRECERFKIIKMPMSRLTTEYLVQIKSGGKAF